MYMHPVCGKYHTSTPSKVNGPAQALYCRCVPAANTLQIFSAHCDNTTLFYLWRVHDSSESGGSSSDVKGKSETSYGSI